jgi:hypothetical protein
MRVVVRWIVVAVIVVHGLLHQGATRPDDDDSAGIEPGQRQNA